jgi:hypothetical protein
MLGHRFGACSDEPKPFENGTSDGQRPDGHNRRTPSLCSVGARRAELQPFVPNLCRSHG